MRCHADLLIYFESFAIRSNFIELILQLTFVSNTTSEEAETSSPQECDNREGERELAIHCRGEIGKVMRHGVLFKNANTI